MDFIKVHRSTTRVSKQALPHNMDFTKSISQLTTWILPSPTLNSQHGFHQVQLTRAGLPYILPPKYDLQLAAGIANKLNALPNSRTGPDSCPYTIVTKLKPPTPKGTFGIVYMVDSSDSQHGFYLVHLSTDNMEFTKSNSRLTAWILSSPSLN